MPRLLRALVAALAVAFVAAVIPPAARAATIAVNTTTDPQFTDGTCSLRDAVMSANTDTAVNGCPAGSGADTIVLGSGVYTLSTPPSAGDTIGQNGDLDILHGTTITGAGSALTIISGDGQSDRIFDLQPNATASISGVWLEYGTTGNTADSTANGGQVLVEAGAQLTLSASAVSHGNTPALGGGIYNGGTLSVVNSQLRFDSAGAGGAIASGGTSKLTITGSLIANNLTSYLAPDGYGGAVFVSGNQRLTATGTTFQGNRGYEGGAIYTAGPLTLTDDAIIDNHADGNGGGIEVAAGATGASTLSNVRLLRNTATGASPSVHGGAIDLSGPLTVNTSTLDANRGFVGGGVYVEPSGALTMNRSTVSNNDGAADPAGNGDGLFNAGSASLTNVTVSGNGQGSTKGQGGGIYNSGSLTLLNDTIAMNEASFAGGDGGNIYNTGSANATDTIIDLALSSGDCGGTPFTSAGDNVKDVDGYTCFVAAQPSDVFADPLLGPLQNNGGPTSTHAIPSTSPAKDAGAGCAGVDQRGVGRPQGAACDVGAYEFALCGGVVVNIVGTAGNDVLNGTSGGDGILGLNGNDTINAGGGNDAICPGGGSDIAGGGAGDDTFFLNDGIADTANGGKGTDTATIDPGLDVTTHMEVIH